MVFRIAFCYGVSDIYHNKMQYTVEAEEEMKKGVSAVKTAKNKLQTGKENVAKIKHQEKFLSGIFPR